MKTIKKLCLYFAAICLSLCACSAPNTVPDEKNDIQDSPSVTAAESQQDVQTETDIDFEASSGITDEEDSQNRLYNFTPILSENDIDYMGIPYGELTADQFIQLWAQCTQECNVQRLYAISYCNYSYEDTPDREEKEKHALKEYAENLLHLELIGRMLFCYSDVELIEIEDAPEGYYDIENDVKNTEELHYVITCIRTVYEQGEKIDEVSEENRITLKKINGFWKIGIQFSSSPYFF